MQYKNIDVQFFKTGDFSDAKKQLESNSPKVKLFLLFFWSRTQTFIYQKQKNCLVL